MNTTVNLCDKCGRPLWENLCAYCKGYSDNLADHQTKDGYCCACEYDIAGFQKQKAEMMREVVEAVEKQHLISCTVGAPYLIKQDDTLTTLTAIAEKHNVQL